MHREASKAVVRPANTCMETRLKIKTCKKSLIQTSRCSLHNFLSQRVQYDTELFVSLHTSHGSKDRSSSFELLEVGAIA